MSDGGLIVLWFLLSLSGCVLVIWACLATVKRRVARWNGSLAVQFVMTLGGFGQRQIENWKRWGGYDEGQGKILTKYQVLGWFGMILWVLISMAVVMGYKALTYKG